MTLVDTMTIDALAQLIGVGIWDIGQVLDSLSSLLNCVKEAVKFGSSMRLSWAFY